MMKNMASPLCQPNLWQTQEAVISVISNDGPVPPSHVSKMRVTSIQLPFFQTSSGGQLPRVPRGPQHPQLFQSPGC